jgi:hypothetical protein
MTFTEQELAAIRHMIDYLKDRCGGGEDVSGAILYTGAARLLPDDDGKSVVALARKLRKETH